MSFIPKFLTGRTLKDYHKIIESLESRITSNEKYIGTVNRHMDIYFHKITELEGRMASLEVTPIDVPIMPLKSKVNVSTLPEDKNNQYSTTSAIIDILTKNKGKKLHSSAIYDLIKTYNLINPNITKSSFIAIIYELARKNKISLSNGKRKGMFFIEQKKGH